MKLPYTTLSAVNSFSAIVSLMRSDEKADFTAMSTPPPKRFEHIYKWCIWKSLLSIFHFNIIRAIIILKHHYVYLYFLFV